MLLSGLVCSVVESVRVSVGADIVSWAGRPGAEGAPAGLAAGMPGPL